MSWEDAKTVLLAKGYGPASAPETTMPPEGETVDIETTVIIGRARQRAVAKISLNYLARVGGGALARAAQFDGVRSSPRGVPRGMDGHDVGADGEVEEVPRPRKASAPNDSTTNFVEHPRQ
jgi:hypothetical protein